LTAIWWQCKDLVQEFRNITNPFYFVKLNCEARADLHAWSVFIRSFNGKSVFLSDNWVSSDHLKLFTDASENIGYAAVFGSWWFANSWTKSLQTDQAFKSALASQINFTK
jgi:hypothetical protein